MKKALLFLLFLSILTIGFSQGPGDVYPSWMPDCDDLTSIYLGSQSEVDNFPIDYPNLSVIDGCLGIVGQDITNVDSLYSITEVNGNLLIGTLGACWPPPCLGNVMLADLSGLQNLTTVNGALVVAGNLDLPGLNGIENIDYNALEGIIIVGNSMLSNCSIEMVCGYISIDSANVDIHDNAVGCDTLPEVQAACFEPCLSGGITFTSQQQVDDFPSLHPDCTEIEGELIVQGNDITNLDSLAQITSCGSLILGESLAGNPLLSNIDGLSNITNITWELRLMGNDALSSIAALSFENTFIDEINLIENNALLSLEGLENVETTNFLTVEQNDALTDLSGLNNLNTIYIYFAIENNESLLTFSGLENLTTLSNHFNINGNDALTNIDALSNLTTLYAIIQINENAQLSNLNGLENVDASTPVSLEILNNPLLATCNNSFICAFLSDVNNSNYIEFNASGCNSADDVLNACILDVEEANASQVAIYPNPVNDILRVESGELSISAIRIYTHLGQAMPVQGGRTIDVSAFPKGVYVVEVESENVI